jgi:hypothetical protein
MENIFKKSINIVLLSLLFFSPTIIITGKQEAIAAIKLLSEEKFKPQSSFLFFGKSKTTEDNEKIQSFLNDGLDKLIEKSLKMLFFKETADILKEPAYYVLLIAIHHDCFADIKNAARPLLLKKDEQIQAFNQFFASESRTISGRHILTSNQNSKYFSDLKLYFEVEKSLNTLENIAKRIQTFSKEEQTLFSKLSDGEFNKSKEKLGSLIEAFIWVKFSSLKKQAEEDKNKTSKEICKKSAVSFLKKTEQITLVASGTGSINDLSTKDGAMVVGLGVAAVCTILYLGNKIRLSILQIPFIKKHFDEKAKAKEKAKEQKKGSKKVKVVESKRPQ